MGQRWTKKALGDLALEVRGELGLCPNEPLDPYALAEEYGISVYQVGDLGADGCSAESIDFFTVYRPDRWSAALVPCGPGRFIVENSAHCSERRRSNVAHEMAHLLLEHEFDGILFTDGGCRSDDVIVKAREQGAADLSGELLIPTTAAQSAAWDDMTNEAVAQRFEVSIEFARWRMNLSGARKIVERARAKRR